MLHGSRTALLKFPLIAVVNGSAGKEYSSREHLGCTANECAVAGLVDEKRETEIGGCLLDDLSDNEICRIKMRVGCVQIRKVVSQKIR